MLVALMLQAAAVPAPAPAPYPEFDRIAWGEFSRSPALMHMSERVMIATDPLDGRSPAQPHFHLRLVRTGTSGSVTVRWADSRTCPAVRTLVARFAAVPLPTPRPPRLAAPDDIVIIMDGIGYAATLPVGYGHGSIDERVTVRSNVGTPLATWIDESLALVRTCWPEEAGRL